MKTFSNRLFLNPPAAQRVLFYNIFSRIRTTPFGILFVVLICFTSCLPQYYKIDTKTRVEADSIQLLINEHKYFIIHSYEEDYALTQLKVNGDRIEAKTETPSEEYLRFLQPNNLKAKRYHGKDKEAVLNAVRLYTSDSVNYNQQISIPLKNISRLDTYQFNKSKTTKAHLGVYIGIPLGIAGLILIGVLLTPH